jgi:hypothetical protein
VAYATLAELRAWVGIPVADTADDTYLTLALDAASAQVDAFCDRTFLADGSVTVRYFSPDNPLTLDVDPISTLTGLIVATDEDGTGTYETTWTIGTDFRAEPVNAAAHAQPWTRLASLGTRWWPRLTYRPAVSVTAKFGFPGGVAPAAVKQATLIQGAHLWKRKDAVFGITGSPEFGSELRVLDELDRDATRLLRPYRRNWWVI